MKLNNPPVTVVVVKTCPVGVSGPWRSTNVMFNRPVFRDVGTFGTEGLFVTLTPSVSPGTKNAVATPDATGFSLATLFCDMAVMNIVEFLTKLDGMISDMFRAINDCVQSGSSLQAFFSKGTLLPDGKIGLVVVLRASWLRL